MIFWAFTEKSDFYGGGQFTKINIEGSLPKRSFWGGGGLGKFADLRGGALARKRRGWCF